MGTWFVFNPANGQIGDGPFLPNTRFGLGSITDGTSNTMMAAEVRSWTHVRRTGGPTVVAVPKTVLEVESVLNGGTVYRDNGHTEWFSGNAHHEGVTTVLLPNASPRCSNGSSIVQPCDYSSWQEGSDGTIGKPSYAVVTSRSYHNGVVVVTMLDGSVRTVSENIDLPLWRATGTRNGGEVTTE